MNYIGAIVKILEVPQQKDIKNTISITQVRAQLAQSRKSQIVDLVFWGNLADDLTKYYNPNDYILIEGYVSIFPLISSESNKESLRKIQITVLKIYPFLLSSNKLNFKPTN